MDDLASSFNALIYAPVDLSESIVVKMNKVTGSWGTPYKADTRTKDLDHSRSYPVAGKRLLVYTEIERLGLLE